MENETRARAVGFEPFPYRLAAHVIAGAIGGLAALAQLGLDARAHAPAAALSHGEKRQLELAIALAMEPRLLLLDEPLAGTGAEEAERLIRIRRGLRGRYGILLVEHDMEAVFALADRVSVLAEGRLIATGAPAEIRANAEVRAAYLGDEDLAHPGARLMLLVEGLAAAYGQSQALCGVGFELRAGEVGTLLGRNGMGKTTTVRAIMGLLPSVRGRQTAGRVAFEGRDIAGLPPQQVARLGIGLVPEGRQVFPTLTVEENLVATAVPRGRWGLAAVYGLFPRLAERRRHTGRNLSGGEQQMLAVGRALMTNPRRLVLDEATEGLAPLIRAEIWAVLERLKREGQAILLIAKNLSAVRRLADRHAILERGRTVWSGDGAALLAAPEIKERYLHV